MELRISVCLIDNCKSIRTLIPTPENTSGSIINGMLMLVNYAQFCSIPFFFPIIEQLIWTFESQVEAYLDTKFKMGNCPLYCPGCIYQVHNFLSHHD